MSKFGSYTGTQLLNMEMKQRDWLIEGLIKEGDSVILVGDPKAGKTLLKQQMICALTSAQPFLDKYNIPQERKITDIQLEGELSDTQDRFQRMMVTQEFNPDIYHLLFEAPLTLNAERTARELIKRIEAHHIPDVLFIDPIYLALQGSLSDDQPVRGFLGNLRIIKEAFGCTLILLHHTHKLRINYKTGELIDEGDDAMFGSQFFKAWPDHILLFVYDKKNDLRVLSCQTQRSGKVQDKIQLKLVQPNPLYFKPTDEQPERSDFMYGLLLKNPIGLTISSMIEKSDWARASIYRALKVLLAEGLIEKDTSRPVMYRPVSSTENSSEKKQEYETKN